MKTEAIIIFVIFIHTTLSIDNPEELQNLEEQPTPKLEAQPAPRSEQPATRPQIGNEKVNYDVELDDGKITYESNIIDRSYSYRLETSDGTNKHEAGHFEDEESLVVEGGYEYIDDNGVKFSVSYVADKNGYRPKVSFGTGGSPGSNPRQGAARALKEPEDVPSTTVKIIEPAVTEPLPDENVEK